MRLQDITITKSPGVVKEAPSQFLVKFVFDSEFSDEKRYFDMYFWNKRSVKETLHQVIELMEFMIRLLKEDD